MVQQTLTWAVPCTPFGAVMHGTESEFTNLLEHWRASHPVECGCQRPSNISFDERAKACAELESQEQMLRESQT